MSGWASSQPWLDVLGSLLSQVQAEDPATAARAAQVCRAWRRASNGAAFTHIKVPCSTCDGWALLVSWLHKVDCLHDCTVRAGAHMELC